MRREELRGISKEVYEQIGVAMTCRSFDEYRMMFGLNDEVLSRRKILDVAAGASSFVAEVNSKGNSVFAVDPLYEMNIEEMKEHGENEIISTTEKIGRIQHLFLWDYYGSLEGHQKKRERSLEVF